MLFIQWPQNHNTAALVAAYVGSVSCLKLLIERGANLDVANKVRLIGYMLILTGDRLLICFGAMVLYIGFGL